jgi:hypothetical protein
MVNVNLKKSKKPMKCSLMRVIGKSMINLSLETTIITIPKNPKHRKLTPVKKKLGREKEILKRSFERLKK